MNAEPDRGDAQPNVAGDSHAVRRLLPDPAATTVAEQLEGLDPGASAPPGRPYVMVNFVASVDGRIAVGGRSGALGSDTDTEMLQRLRTRVDAVMVGAGTVRAERYGRIVSDPKLRAYRERGGLSADPIAVIPSNSFDLPWDAPLFTDGGGRVIVLTASGDEPPDTATPVEVVRHDGAVDLAEGLAWLHRERKVGSVLCEGGPTLHGQLQSAGMVDELFLTIAPKLAGGGPSSIISGELPAVLGMELAWLLDAGGELFCRYRIAAPAAR